MRRDLDLPLRTATGWTTWPACICDVAPHVTVATFASHQYATETGLIWRVSNIETGMVIPGTDAKTRSMAETLARQVLADKTDPVFRKTFREWAS